MLSESEILTADLLVNCFYFVKSISMKFKMHCSSYFAVLSHSIMNCVFRYGQQHHFFEIFCDFFAPFWAVALILPEDVSFYT